MCRVDCILFYSDNKIEIHVININKECWSWPCTPQLSTSTQGVQQQYILQATEKQHLIFIIYPQLKQNTYFYPVLKHTKPYL